MSEWISVEDRLPENGDDVLCAIDNAWGNTKVTGRYDGGWYYPSTSLFSSSMLQGVTHWMPLPKPPCNTK